MSEPEQPFDQIVDPKLVQLDALLGWMDAEGLGSGPLSDVTSLSGGTQNLLLRFERSGKTYVLRRPPLHLRRNSNETMRREARVLGALVDTDVPHPRLFAACGDENVIGAAFYLMQPIDGFNPTEGLPELHSGSSEVRHRMGLAMVDGIAALARVDYQQVGLEGFGKPEGFLERQVGRWKTQLDGYSELDGYDGPEIPGVDDVARWLDAERPLDWRPGILHGDFHLANVMFRPDSGELAAMVDWELSTVGDPLLDLGWLMATWPDDDGPAAGAIGLTPWEGWATRDELVEHYARSSDRDLTHANWYAVMACYKLGIILEGTHARAAAGKADQATGDLLHATTVGLFERALGWIG
jgi:aminoglycoside phosphotransferase (APT) family kinase protein